jgi:uncharacterized membrane protein YhaH (DUF805 family)
VSNADIFLALEGRLDRERWRAAVALFIATVLATMVGTWHASRHGWMGPAAVKSTRAFVEVALLVPWLTLDWKRFQDLDRPGRWALLCPSLMVVARLLGLPNVAARVPLHGTITEAVAWAQFGVAVWIAYVLGCLPGTEGPNRYGPDPRPFPARS